MDESKSGASDQSKPGASEQLQALKDSYGELQSALKTVKDSVAVAEEALKDLKVKINAKLGAVPFIAGASVKSARNQID